MRLIVDWLSPVLAASMRLDQCVAPFGVFSSVSRTTCSTFSSPISRGAPGRGSSPSPTTPSEMKRLRQRPTVKPVVRNFAATAALLAPATHSSTIRARKATDRALRDCLAIRSNSARCALVTNNSCFFGRPRRGSIAQHRTPQSYMQSIYDSGDYPFARIVLTAAVVTLAICLIPALAPTDGRQQFAALGNCKLDSGQEIIGCQLGYRTWGKLNADRTNAMLIPTWFTGTSAQWAGNVGTGKLVDPSKYFVVVVDALGDGVSSSPSNSKAQPRMAFPAFTTRDMVRTEYRFATETLHLRHLHAVMGVSMGGMQTFEWIVDYPDFMDLAIPIVGSTRLTSYDLLLWRAEEDAIRADPG